MRGRGSSLGGGAEQADGRLGLVYVVNALHPGGTERLVVEMSRACAAQFRVSVVCLDEPGRWAGELRDQGIPVHCLWRQQGIDLAVSFRLARLLRAGDAVIVHAHQCTPWFYGALARLLFPRARLLFEEHGRFHPERDSLLRRVINRAVIAPLTHRFVAVSQDIRRRLARYEGLDARAIEVVYNGVAPIRQLASSERAAKRRELGFDADRFVVGTVGRFDPIKNLPMLVRSLAVARQREDKVAGLLVGDGAEFTAIGELVGNLGLTGDVRLTGFRSDARSLVQCMDLFVLSSFSEGTSMALLEAMAAGVPVAVTAVGGNPEIVSAGETGWVIPSDDVEALTAAILEAAGDRVLRERFARAAERRFQERFRLDRMMAKYVEIYRALGQSLCAGEAA